jgi:Tfp pilus assembly protein PilV
MSLKRRPRHAEEISMPRPVLADERGYTLVELMVAALVLVIGVLGTFQMLDGANQASVANNARMGATNLAREILEDARAVDYKVLTPTQMVPALQARSEAVTTSPWTVTRRGITYTIDAQVCTFDDPKDNVSATPPANVCTPQAPVPASATNLRPETQPDDFRRVTLDISWDRGTGSRNFVQTSLVNNPSGGLGPRITKFQPAAASVANPDVPVQFTSGTAATFPTETTSATSVRWDSDGMPNGSGDATGGPQVWTTTWQLGPAATPQAPDAVTGAVPVQYGTDTVLDGVYLVTAQAFDDRGVAGDSRAQTLLLNRSAPLTVTGFSAGVNELQNTVEFRWNANPERDIIGYEVYEAGPDAQPGNGNDTLVCSTDKPYLTACTDTSPAPGEKYFVVALDRPDLATTGGSPRSSTYAWTRSPLSGARPYPPVLVSVLPDPDTGDPQLTWLPNPLQPVTVGFYRIYRAPVGTADSACCTLANRYDFTPTDGTGWVDPNPGTEAHRYWVTAVSAELNESDPSNHLESAAP